LTTRPGEEKTHDEIPRDGIHGVKVSRSLEPPRKKHEKRAEFSCDGIFLPL
jgi:hypothetical protein